LVGNSFVEVTFTGTVTISAVSVGAGYVTSKFVAWVAVGEGEAPFPGDLFVAVADTSGGQNLGS
jgi:hypothetical protein